MSDEIYKVVIYARVSTDDKGQTNETQIRDAKALCERNGWTIVRIYTDEQTGKNTDRDGFLTMKGLISQGKIDYVVARDQDRISREPKDYQEFLDFCSGYRTRLRFTSNSAEPETASGVIIDNTLCGLAKADNIKRSTTTQGGMFTAKLNGKHVGRMLRFCWADEISLPENANRIQTIVDEEHKYKTVIMTESSILELADNGFSVQKAARMILDIGPETLKRALRERGIMNEYQERLKASKLGNRPQGIPPTRVEDKGVEPPTRVDPRPARKGTLTGGMPTLMGD